jgi:hypothetical protein
MMRHETAILFLFSVILAGQQLPNLSKRKVSANMSEEGQLLWASAPQTFAGRPVVDFSYSPVLGLSDADFHQITTRNWDAMKSSAPDAVARLDVPPDLTVQQLQQAIGLLSSKGEYRTIEILVRR